MENRSNVMQVDLNEVLYGHSAQRTDIFSSTVSADQQRQERIMLILLEQMKGLFLEVRKLEGKVQQLENNQRAYARNQNKTNSPKPGQERTPTLEERIERIVASALQQQEQSRQQYYNNRGYNYHSYANNGYGQRQREVQPQVHHGDGYTRGQRARNNDYHNETGRRPYSRQQQGYAYER